MQSPLIPHSVSFSLAKPAEAGYLGGLCRPQAMRSVGIHELKAIQGCFSPQHTLRVGRRPRKASSIWGGACVSLNVNKFHDAQKLTKKSSTILVPDWPRGCT